MPTRDMSSSLKSHLEESVTMMSFLWDITRKDNTVFRFTDADSDIPWGGNDYKALNSGQLSAFQQQSEMNVDNFDFQVILNSGDIDRDDVIAGLFDFATVKVYMINREHPEYGVIKLIRGVLGKTQVLDDHRAIIEFRSLTQLLQQSIGKTDCQECDADLGDDNCNVTLSTYTVTGTLTGVTNNAIFADTSRAEADDYFNYGFLTWTSGNNNGLSIEVKDYELESAEGIFTLIEPMPFTVQVGDGYSVYRGCSKTRTSCKNFNNIAEFRGEPDIPGFDKAVRVPDINPDAGLHD